jgi:hypothetical protein
MLKEFHLSDIIQDLDYEYYDMVYHVSSEFIQFIGRPGFSMF